MYKFEKLEVWKLALDYIDCIYEITEKLPRHEEFNLKQQLRRAATSIALNIAEGSTGQSDAEQSRFLGMALRSLIETVACQHFIRQRQYLADPGNLDDAYRRSEFLAKKVQALRKSISPRISALREEQEKYVFDDGP